MPERDISCAEIRNNLNANLADPLFWKSSNVSILLGIDTWASIIKERSYQINKNFICHESTFGNILLGKVNSIVKTSNNKNMHSIQSSMEEIEKTIKKFWEFEDLSLCAKKDIEHDIVENIFREKHYRDESGKFVVAIPLNQNLSEIGSSRARALHRFLMLEKRFERDK